ncbi:hypothetical protein FB45DRAFT_1012280 [Roridomyces roridus]|uniref:Uncharacterized protein n=1 Tax=Roridomyces roridus TaxID=1738132 RepID=A0AAD7B000_9AGAR|nr:hypothetical protein FB45DRAFT_1012280 [Roridomyces roridus]
MCLALPAVGIARCLLGLNTLSVPKRRPPKYSSPRNDKRPSGRLSDTARMRTPSLSSFRGHRCTALARTRGERNAAEASASRPARPKGPAVGSIPKPSNMTKVTINFIRRKLKLSGDKNDEKWNDLRAEVRRFMDAGLLDMSIGWKAQDDRRLIKIRDAIEAAHPELLCFRNQWGTEYLIHETFSGQKTYKKCKGKAGTYRARARKARRSKRGTDNSDDDEEDSGCSGRGPLAPAESPTSSPPPSPRRSPPPHAQSLPELTPEPEEDR